MNGNKLLLDTNIILYLLHGDETLAAILENRQVYVSFITEVELYSFKKLSSKEKARITDLLSSCTIIDLNSGVKNLTIKLRQEFGLKLPDCFIAATAQYFDMPLFSADKDFEKVTSLDLLSYEK